MTAIFGVLLFALFQAPSTAPEPIRVHLFTTEAEFVDEELERRRSELAELRKELQHKRHAKDLVIVEDSSIAHVRVEIVLDGEGYETSRIRGTITVARTAMLSVGTYTTKIKVYEDFGEAGLLASRIKNWIVTNRATILDKTE